MEEQEAKVVNIQIIYATLTKKTLCHGRHIAGSMHMRPT